jgi:membrane associated rhomboid family serine protease
MGTYRGISGVDFAVLAWLLLTMAVQDRDRKAVVWISVLMMMGAKSIWEMTTGQALLPTSAPAGVEVVGITHVIGLAAGVLMAAASALPRHAQARQAESTERVSRIEGPQSDTRPVTATRASRRRLHMRHHARESA